MEQKSSNLLYLTLGVAALASAFASFILVIGIPFGVGSLILAAVCIRWGTPKARTFGYVALFVGFIGLGTNVMLIRTAYFLTQIDR